MALVGLLAFAGCNKQSPTPAPAPTSPAPVATTSQNQIMFFVKKTGTVVIRKADSQILVKKGDQLTWKVGKNGQPIWILFDEDGYCTNPANPSQSNDFEGTSNAPATCTVAVDDTAITPHLYKIFDEDPNATPPQPKGKRKEGPFSKPRSCGGCAVYGGN
jgi:hypothetical protein